MFDLIPWRVKKLPDDSFAYLVPDAEIKTDGGKMVAHVIVSTPTMDRERDIMMPRGCRTKSHEKNPAVLCNHRKDWPLVGRAEGPDRKYTVKCFEDRIEASNWFDQHSKLGLQTFRLVESKALPGVSPGFLTIPNGVQKVKGSDGHPAMLYTDWDLVEISHCPIGMNPDALVLAVEKGFGGEQLLPELKEMLLPFVPPPKAQVTGGWESAKALLDEEEGIDLSDAEPPPLTPSTTYYHAMYEKAFDLLDMAQELSAVQELDATKEASHEILWHLGGILTVCRQKHADHILKYPDQPGLPDGVNADISPKKMAEYRIEAMEVWDEYRQAKAVAAESSPQILEAVKFCRMLAGDPLMKTSVRAVAKSMVGKLSNVRLVAVPTDDEEEREWGAASAAVDKLLERLGATA